MNLITHRSGFLVLVHGHISHIVKIHYRISFKNSQLPGTDQTKYIPVVMMTMGGPFAQNSIFCLARHFRRIFIVSHYENNS